MIYRLKTKRVLWIPTGSNFQNHRRYPLPPGTVLVLLERDWSRDGVPLDWFVTPTGLYGYILVTASAEGWNNLEQL